MTFDELYLHVTGMYYYIVHSSHSSFSCLMLPKIMNLKFAPHSIGARSSTVLCTLVHGVDTL